MSLLRTDRLSRHFGGIRAVDDVSFSLPRGQVRAVIGPNGAGKTTFVSLLSGRLPPTTGKVFFEDQDITALPAYQRIRLGLAYTFQITSIFDKLSLAENVELAVQQLPGSGDPARVIAEVLAQVGLDADATAIAGEQSYGHQRLLEIAMGLAQRPKLLILDEPTQGLSEAEITQFIAVIQALDPDTTVLLIEHNMHVVMALADEITVLDQGRLLAEGSPEDIQSNAEVRAAYLGD